MIGQILDGKYEVLRLIGEGGMGAVYEAKATDDGMRCAVKVINDEAVAKDEVLIQRFEREAYAAQKVRSPNIVEIFSAGHDDATGHPYMVMEMLDGENALQMLKRIGPMSPQLAVRVGIQTCEGLAKAHEAGVVHRDIKPANLFITERDEAHVVKLLDFGVAKFKMDQASESDNESLTRTGSMLGSPMYMSPEQARGLKTIDHRADLWSLGIVLHQLLTGRVPFQDIDGLGELIITICSEPPPLVNVAAPWVPQKLAEVIAGSLKLSTSERYQDASAFGEALRGCLEGTDTIAPSMIVEMTDAEKAPVTATPSPTPSPAAVPTAATVPDPTRQAAAAAAAGGFVAHDATVALEDVEAEMQKALEARKAKQAAAIEAPPATQALPDTSAAAAGADNLAATVAFPIDGFELPEAPPAAPAAAAKATPAAPASNGGQARDERVLAKHREAQRAAIEAARLGPAGAQEKSGSGRMVIAIIAGVLLGAGLLGAYYYKVKNEAPAPTPTSTPVAPDPTPGATPEPTATTTTTAAPTTVPSTTPSSSASADAAAAGTVRIFPANATVLVDGKPAKFAAGVLTLESAPGTRHQITVTAYGKSTVKTVSMTDKGPVPNVLKVETAAAPKKPSPAPGGAKKPAPKKPPSPSIPKQL